MIEAFKILTVKNIIAAGRYHHWFTGTFTEIVQTQMSLNSSTKLLQSTYRERVEQTAASGHFGSFGQHFQEQTVWIDTERIWASAADWL